MIPRNREQLLLMAVAIFALLVLGLCDGRPACAQVTETQPFDMQHPETQEPGAWIPRWLQVEHLHTENDLKTCTEKTSKQDQALGARETELEHRQAALEESKQAEVALQTSLAHTKVRLQEEQDSNEAKGDWLIVTTTTSVVATVLAVVLAAI